MQTFLERAKGDCCAVMTFVLNRARKNDKLGLMREGMPDKRGKFKEVIVIRMRGGKRSEQLASVILCSLNFCPFCGRRVNGSRRPKLKIDTDGLKDRSRSARRGQS